LPFVLLIGARLEGQGAATIPASSALYTRLEAISARVPVRGMFLGERPLSRREAMRLVAALTHAVDSSSGVTPASREWARAELALLTSALNDTRWTRVGDRTRVGLALRADILTNRARFERIESNGLGTIDAATHPFTAGRQGWPVLRGTIATMAPTLVAGTRERVAIVLQPSASLTAMSAGGWTAERFFHRAYARGVIRNVAMQLGAEERRWGQSPNGALFISGNALPLPALSVGNDSPMTLPWLLRFAGPVRVVAFLSDLGASQTPSHARLVGWQASMQPWSRFELGVAVTTHTGGNGGPGATFIERIIDLFPVIDALAPQRSDLQISNKLAGGNLRLRFPELSGLDVYYELQIDDFDGRRLRSSMVDDAAHLLGLRLPVFVGGDALTWRAEWHRTSLRLYEHGQFLSGSTYRGRIIGSPLGPHAAAGYLSVTWQPSTRATVEVTAADERRDPSQYTVTVAGPHDRGFTFIRVTDDPDFRNRRLMASLQRLMPSGAVNLSLGYNRAWRTAQAGRGEWMGLISLTSYRLATF
jgi:hypothetical protein